LTIEVKGYEQWGRPVGVPNRCSRFDNGNPVRKFNVGVQVQNNSTETIKADEWYPEFFSNTGGELVACYYVYGTGFPGIPPGENRHVTFAVFAEQNEYVREMKIQIFGEEYRRCFSAAGSLEPCP